MKVLVDLNVFLDVIQNRKPHNGASAAILSEISWGKIGGAVPGHALTTVYYLVSRFANRESANEAIDWILGDFEVIGEDRNIMLRARSLSMEDFEDAVVAAAAEAIHCDWVVTRNVRDFGASPVSAITPKELMELLTAG